jgi:hypothetical protein
MRSGVTQTLRAGHSVYRRAQMEWKATPRFALLIVVVAVAFGGCASPQFSRIDADRELYESWPIEIRQAVLDGKAEVGMTPDMVKMALGKPTEIVSRSVIPGQDEIWVYRTGGYEDHSGVTGYPYPSSGGMGYPYPSSSGIGVGGPGIGISTGPGGTIISPSVGIGIGGGTVGIGGGSTGGVMMPAPMPMPSSPLVEREVVFRDGVVYRADNAP